MRVKGIYLAVVTTSHSRDGPFPSSPLSKRIQMRNVCYGNYNFNINENCYS